MNLTISILAASVVLRFTTPGAGSYTLFGCSGRDNSFRTVEGSGHVDQPSHVVVKVPVQAGEPFRLFLVQWQPDKPKE